MAAPDQASDTSWHHRKPGHSAPFRAGPKPSRKGLALQKPTPFKQTSRLDQSIYCLATAILTLGAQKKGEAK